VSAITFDFGQTLAELDSAMLAARLAERGISVAPERIDAECLGAWGAYNGAKQDGAQGEAAWKVFMRTLLTRSGIESSRASQHADWLWTEQPYRNLWRRPIPGMLELARELAARRIPVGVLSNSEGRLAELIDELGWSEVFQAVVDSGRLPFEKPDPRIFAHTAEALGVATRSLVHVGDAWEADVRGALDAGARAIYFSPDVPPRVPDGVACCHDVAAVRRALNDWGLLT
jgi:HAD superfamily hydrolase (TIGR01549 family)